MKVFQLPRNDINKVDILIQLKKPLLQGQTMHHFILFQIDKDLETNVKVNLTQEEIDVRYKGQIEQELEGNVWSNLCKLLKVVANTEKIITSGDFKSG